MQSRRRSLGRHVVSRPVALDLVNAVKRNVETVAAFVLDDRDLDCALAHEDLLHAAIDPDPVLEMNDIIARLERSETLECTPSHVASGAPEASLAAEDF